MEECIRARQYQEASKYILKCDPPVRPMLFVKIGAFKEAGEQAYLNKDVEGLRYVTNLIQIKNNLYLIDCSSERYEQNVQITMLPKNSIHCLLS